MLKRLLMSNIIIFGIIFILFLIYLILSRALSDKELYKIK